MYAKRFVKTTKYLLHYLYLAAHVFFGRVTKTNLAYLCKRAQTLNSHKLFEAACNRFAEKQMFNYSASEKRFVAQGWGEGNVNVYRHIKTANTGEHFEKVVFADSEDRANTELYIMCYKDMVENSTITPPKVVNVEISQNLVIYHYEHIRVLSENAKFYNTKEKRNLLLYYSKEILKLNYNKKIAESYRGVNIYNVQIVKQGLSYLRNSNIESKALTNELNRISLHPRVIFSHGDLTVNNFNKFGYLWDWDRAGKYPIGFDIAWGVVSGLFNDHPISELYRISLSLGLEIYAKEASQEHIKTNILVFVVIFYSRICFIRQLDCNGLDELIELI